MPSRVRLACTLALCLLPLDPAEAHAAAMGQLLIREGSLDEGRLYLERAAAAPGATALVRYQVAAALHEAFDYPGRPADVDAAIEAAYRRAIAQGQAPADSYAGLARLLADRRLTSRDQLELMREAIERAPGRSDYRLTYGLMLANREAFEEARTMLAPLSASSADGGASTQAAALLARIDDFESRRATYERRRAAAGVAEPWTERFDAPVRLPELRPLGPGEAHVFGILTAIECAPERVTLVIRDRTRDTRLSAASIDEVAVVSFRSDAIAEPSCGARTTSGSRTRHVSSGGNGRPPGGWRCRRGGGGPVRAAVVSAQVAAEALVPNGLRPEMLIV